MKIFLFIEFIILSSITFSYCQNIPQSNDLDNIYTPPVGSIFDNNSSRNANSTSGNSNVSHSDNIILFNVGSLIRTNYYITYERALNEQFSVLAGLGSYFGRDYIAYLGVSFSRDLISLENRGFTTIFDSDNTDFKRKNIQFGFTGRFYLNNDFKSRNLFEMGARFYYWNFVAKTTSYTSNRAFYGNPEFLIRNQQYFLNYVHQWSSEGKIKIIHEFYTGIGLYIYSFEKLNRVTISSSDETISFYQLTGQRETFIDYSILLGYKLGIGW